MKIVLDCANGAGYKAAPIMLRNLGAKVISMGVKPNGLILTINVGQLILIKYALLLKNIKQI